MNTANDNQQTTELKTIIEETIPSVIPLLMAIGNNSAYFPSIYRGVSDKSFDLIPSLGRIENEELSKMDDATIISFLDLREKEMLDLFKSKSIPYLNYNPNTYYEWLVLAQHHGVPTRLLDWSTNCLVALYFAINGAYDKDGALYFYETPGNIHFEESLLFHKDSVLRPKHIDFRIINQCSVFTIHSMPHKPLRHERLKKFIIPSHCKKQFEIDISRLGINREILFPGLDSIGYTASRMYKY